VRDRDFPHDGEAEAASPACLGAIVVEPHEPVPDAFPVGTWYSGAVVGHADARPLPRDCHGEVHFAVRIPQGIVDKVGDHPAELGLIAEHDGPRQRAGVQADTLWHPAPGTVGHHAGEIHRPHRGVGLPVQGCEHEEVVEGAGQSLMAG
jgi:hypothetical protein